MEKHIASTDRAPDADPLSATAAVVKHIKESIRSGTLAPGQRIREWELIETCGVGRSAVREALQALVAEGFLSASHRRSVRVRQFTREEVWSQHQIREVLEGLAASLAAGRHGNLGFQSRLMALHKAMADCVERDDRATFLQLNYDFHATIVEMSGNPGIQEHLDRAKTSQLRLQAARFTGANTIRQSYEEHQPIIDAILRGDCEGAEAAMRRHIRGTRKVFLEMPDELFAGDAG